MKKDKTYKKKKSTKKRTKRRYNRKTLRAVGGTGILLNDTSDVAFDFFMKNSSFELKSYGSNGITILVTLRTGLESPYKSMDSNNYGSQINSIIIKLIINSVILSIIEIDDDSELTSTLLNNVVNESNIQTDIALKTSNYLEPICPSPIYFSENISVELLTIIRNNIVDSDSYYETLLTECINKMIQFLGHLDITKGISVIGMEMAKDCKSLSSLDDESPQDLKNLYFYMAAYIIIKLAIDTGYTHGDYHAENIMINTTKQNYFYGLTGAPLLIDFGYATKIQPDKMNIIKDKYKNKDYVGILEEISTIPRRDGKDLRRDDWREFYGYLYKEFNPDANNQIDRLCMLREEAIQNTVTRFEELHASDPTKPLLPLPKKMRDKMYEGLIIHNEIVIPKFEFTKDQLNNIKTIFGWIYDILGKFTRYTIDQQKCFFIKFCYNYVYILNNVPFEKSLLELYACIALLFIEHFDIETNATHLYAVEFIIFITDNKYTENNIITKINEIYPLFKNKELDSNYAPIFASYSDEKKFYINLMLDPTIYSNPESFFRFVGPVQPRPINVDEQYVFPNNEEDILVLEEAIPKETRAPINLALLKKNK
jgi:hypothetical protein